MSFLYSPLQALDEKVRIEIPNLRPDLIIANCELFSRRRHLTSRFVAASYFHGGGTLL